MDKEAPFPSRFPKDRDLSWGCPFQVGFPTEKEEKDILILDTCNIISLCYFLLRQEIQRISGLQYLNSGEIINKFSNSNNLNNSGPPERRGSIWPNFAGQLSGKIWPNRAAPCMRSERRGSIWPNFAGQLSGKIWPNRAAPCMQSERRGSIWPKFAGQLSGKIWPNRLLFLCDDI